MTLAAPVSLHFVDQQVDLVARPTADSANQPFDHVGDPGPFHQQTPPLALPRVGHHNRGSSRRAAFCARSKHPLAVRYYEYGQMEYGGLPVQSDGGCTQIVDVSGLVAILGNPFLNLVVAQRFPRIIWNGPHAAAAGRRAVCCPTQYRGPRGRAGRSVRRCRRRRWRAVPTGAGSRSRSAGIRPGRR
jgi:hypothetical protein